MNVSADSSPKPRVSASTIDSRGNISRLRDWSIKSEWAWTPELRIRSVWQYTGASDFLDVDVGEKSLHQVIEKSPSGFILESALGVEIVELRFKDSEQKISLTTRANKGGVLRSAACVSQGFIFGLKPRKGAPFIGVDCVATPKAKEQAPDTTELKIYHHGVSLDLNTPSLQPMNEGVSSMILPSPKKPGILARIRMSSSQSRTHLLLIGYKDPKELKRWGINVSIAPTFFHYTESAIDLNMLGLNLTGKISANYQLVPRILDIGGNIFSSVAPIYRSEPVSAPWFVGFNARLGYLLPWTPSGITFKVNIGYYFWSLLVAERAYGVPSVWGPQILLSMTRSSGRDRPFGIYAKYAPLKNDTRFVSIENYEIATGGWLQVASIRSRFPVSVSLDLDYLQASSARARNRVTILSTSLGVTLGF